MNSHEEERLSGQLAMVAEVLREGRTLTQLEATIGLGVGRLAARVRDLKDRGYVIDTEMVEVRKANGDVARVARYSMPMVDQGQRLLSL